MKRHSTQLGTEIEAAHNLEPEMEGDKDDGAAQDPEAVTPQARHHCCHCELQWPAAEAPWRGHLLARG